MTFGWTPEAVLSLTFPQLSALARQTRQASGQSPDSIASPGETRRFLRTFQHMT